MKRAFDIACVLLAAVPALLICAVVALLIRWRLGSPILFSQERPGRNGEIFRLYKFRSMTGERDDNGELLPDEERIPPFGKWLRSTSLDELPELWSILKGDMSLVGPRPLLADYLPLYSERQARRHEVRPGLTGWAQINGRNAIDWESRFEMDVWYVDNQSLWLDIKILVRTLSTVLRREGIHDEGHATKAPFTGTDPPSDPATTAGADGTPEG